MTGSWGRILMVAVGVWLFLSAFAWGHTPNEFTNTWLCGVLAAAIGLASLASPPVRYFNTALAIWLFASAFFVSSSGETTWNNAVAAVILFAASLMRETGKHTGPFSHHRRIPV